MDDKKNKKYTKPEAEVVDFVYEDIITDSLNDAGIAGWDADGENY